MRSRPTYRADNVSEPKSPRAFLLFNNFSKGIKHEEVGAEVIPGSMAEGCCQKLPPVRSAIPQVQAADPWSFEDIVRGKENQVHDEEPEDSNSRRAAGSVW